MKQCSKCKEYKKIEEFHNKRAAFDGKNGRCKLCIVECGREFYIKKSNTIRVRQKEYRADNIEKLRKDNNQYHQKNKDYLNQERRNRYLKHQDVEQQKRKEKYHQNPEKYKEINKLWIKNNLNSRREYTRFFSAKRRFLKKSSTLFGFDVEIRDIYQKCPEGYEVDHIIPLQGKNVCGLHIPWNLQYLTVSENRKKGNKV